MIRLHGLDISYYTGKVEAYLRVKGLPYTLVQMDTRSFSTLGKRMGKAQMPHAELPDGTWLTDSSHIIETLERTATGPAIYPQDAALCFLAHLLEDFADEWMWRPAMAYRWLFAPDALRAGNALALGMLRDVPLPVLVRRAIISGRQRHRFVRGDGVNASTHAAVLAVYPQVLTLLEAILSQQPFVLGRRPSQADFGFFGSMFRHFGSDPTPRAIMQTTAPAVQRWIERLWSGAPHTNDLTPDSEQLDDAIFPMLALVCTDYLPYLKLNAQAVCAGSRHVRWKLGGVAMCTPSSTYRLECLRVLGRRYSALNALDAQRVQNALVRNSGQIVDFSD